jgi:uncharacterized protein
MNDEPCAFGMVAISVVLAAGLWFVTFALSGGVFWLKISVSAAVLATLSLVCQPARHLGIAFNGRNIVIGLLSAVVLYLIFLAGKTLSTALLPFAADQIDAVYGKGTGTPRWLIVVLLFFVTGPCEEIYWRGFLQRQLMIRCGETWGWLLATGIYGFVHISSGNFMLTAAALVAGAFWGAIYWRCRNVSPVIVSHAVWSTIIFAVLPM